MSNRQTRRKTEHMPEVRALSRCFAEELSTMAINFFNPLIEAEKRGENVDFIIDENTKRIFEAKGSEIGMAMKQLMASMQVGTLGQEKVSKKNKSITPIVRINGITK